MEISPLCSNRLKSWCPKFSHAVAKRKQKLPELSRVTCQKLPCVKPKMILKNVCYRNINKKKDEEILGCNFWVFWNPFCKKMEEISREKIAEKEEECDFKNYFTPM